MSGLCIGMIALAILALCVVAIIEIGGVDDSYMDWEYRKDK